MTTCSHASSRTRSCLGACSHSSSPEILATLSRRLVLKLFFSDMWVWSILFLTRSESQADMMVGTFPTFAFCSQLAPHRANFPWAALLSSCCPGPSSKVDLPWVPVISGDKQIHPLRCLQQGNPHHPSLSMPFYWPPPNDHLRIALGWYKGFQWSLNQR